MNAPLACPPAPARSREAYDRGRAMLLLFDLEGYEEAVPLLREAIEADPTNAPAHAALAETYAYWGFRRELNGAESQSYFELAFESAALALQLGPGVGAAHRAMAAALRQGERCDPAERRREARTALDLDPYDGENCHIFWKASGSNLADQSIYKAIAMCPSLASAHIDLGVALCERGRLGEAAYHLGRALEVSPRNSLAHYDLAMVRMRQGRPADAGSLLERGLELHPADALLQTGARILAAGTRGTRP